MAQLSDDVVQEHLEEIRRTGRILAKAKAKAAATTEARKMAKATLMKLARAEGHAKSRDAAEEYAYTHPQYKVASDAMVKAIEEEALAATEYSIAEKEWESWRTLCANERHIGRAG